LWYEFRTRRPQGGFVSKQWVDDVLQFWFGLDPERWWKPDEALDEEIRRRFLKDWSEQRELPVSRFTAEPLTALAAVILFDQFPRNMFRGHADQFSTDHLALAIARETVERTFDKDLEPQERGFLYMPFQHSENLTDQDRSLFLFSRLGDKEQLHYAKLHHAIIERFGRFPHRNAILGRAPRPDEIAAGEVVPW
jgi:uncharacterized protein (DUF924 family)